MKLGLEEALKRLADNSIEELDLSEQKIGDKGAARLAEALEKNTTLKQLNLVGNKIDVTGAGIFAAVLEKNSTLRGLNLGWNDIGDEGMERLALMLEKNITLLQLNLSGNKINDAGVGVERLVEALEKNNTIQVLDLGYNTIGAAGAEKLALVLEKNSTLRKLNLWRNEIGMVGAAKLAVGLEKNSTLRELDLGWNSIAEGGAASLATALEKNNTLLWLNLGENKIGEAEAEKLATALEKNTTLQMLNLVGNKISDALLKKIEGYIAMNKEPFDKLLAKIGLLFNSVGLYKSADVEIKKDLDEKQDTVLELIEQTLEIKQLKSNLNEINQAQLDLVSKNGQDFANIEACKAELEELYQLSFKEILLKLDNPEVNRKYLFLFNLTKIKAILAYETGIILLNENGLAVVNSAKVYWQGHPEEAERELIYRFLKKEREYAMLQEKVKLGSKKGRREQEQELLSRIKSITDDDFLANMDSSIRSERKRIEPEQRKSKLEDSLNKFLPKLIEVELLLDHKAQKKAWVRLLKGAELKEDSPLFNKINGLCGEIRALLKALQKHKTYDAISAELVKAVEYYEGYIIKICAEKDPATRKLLYKAKTKLLSGIVKGEVKPEYIEELTRLKSDSEHGTHLVKMVNEVHYKLWPHAPGVEHMVDSLSKVIAENAGSSSAAAVSAPTELIKVIDSDGKHYPYIASRTVLGSELMFILQQRPEAIDLLDRQNFATMVVLSILTNPQDGKPDNYMVDIDFNADNSIKEYRILGIDNDMAFVPALIRSEKYGNDVTVKNVLYFFPQMTEAVDAKFRKGFTKQLPEIMMIDWLAGLYERDTVYRKLLTDEIFDEREFSGFKEYDRLLNSGHPEDRLRVEEEFNGKYGELLSRFEEEEKTGKASGLESAEDIIKKGMQLPIKFKEGQVRGVYKKLTKIREILLKHKEASYEDLLFGVERVVGRYYAEVKREVEEECAKEGIELSAGAKVMSCIWRIYGKKEYANVPRPDIDKILKYARERGNSSGLTKIATSVVNAYGLEEGRDQSVVTATEEFVASIDFSKLSAEQESIVLQKLQKDLSFITRLVLRGAKISGGEDLLELTKVFKEVKELELIACDEINTDSILLLLSSWRLSGEYKKLIIENCVEVEIAGELTKLIKESSYKELYLRFKQEEGKIEKIIDFAIGKEKAEVMLEQAVTVDLFVKEFYDYLLASIKSAGGIVKKELLNIAASLKEADVLAYLLGNKGIVEEMTAKDYPLLHTAARSGSVGIIKYLVTQGVLINAEYKEETALDKALQKGHMAAAHILHANGARLGEKCAKDTAMVKKLEAMLANVSILEAKQETKEEDTKEDLGLEEKELAMESSVATVVARPSWGARIAEERKSEIEIKGRAA